MKQNCLSVANALALIGTLVQRDRASQLPVTERSIPPKVTVQCQFLSLHIVLRRATVYKQHMQPHARTWLRLK
jgi:hypothetical protein